MALGDMRYEPAVNAVLGRLAHCESTETLAGILYYLGKIRRPECRRALRDVFAQYAGHQICEVAAEHLLEHRNPKDVSAIVDSYLERTDRKFRKDPFAERLMRSVGASGMYGELIRYTERDLLKDPKRTLGETLEAHPLIDSQAARTDEIATAIETGRYQDGATAVVFDARTILAARYPRGEYPDYLEEVFAYDTLALRFLEELSKRSLQWKRAKERENLGCKLITAVLACYFSIHERGGYLHALAPEAPAAELIEVLKGSGPDLPQSVQDRLVHLDASEKLGGALSEALATWGDVWVVRLMGQIGSGAFATDLIRVVRKTDALSPIHRCAIEALNRVDESAHPTIMAAIQNRELINSWDVLPLLEHLPYPESFDTARRLWGSGGIWMLTRFMPQAVKDVALPQR
jgi:hypothetical protein